MKVEKENLQLGEGLQKEWIVTNGLGGYASSTIIGANTRKYHGLLVAPLDPPAKRVLLLSKLDESIEIGKKKYELYTNIGKNYISEGFKYQESFEKNIIPIFKYKVEDITISKTICMVYRRNIVIVYYLIKNGKKKAKMNLAPVMNFRDFHSMNTNHFYNLEQQIIDNKVKIIVDNHIDTPIYISASDGKYIEHQDDTFSNMYYIEEEKRGFFAEENHCVSGRYEIELKPNEEKEISFICSLEENIDEINPREIIESELIRQEKLFEQSEIIDEKKKKTKKELEEDELKRNFLTAIDNFIVYRPKFALHTVIAGYPWFLDWGRDTLISFEGLLLKTKRFEQAKNVLFTITRDIKYGLVPNGYSEVDNSPLYNSVDASLLLFEQVQKYVDYTEDYDFIRDRGIYGKLKDIIENYSKGISFSDNNIFLDEDGLIYSGNERTQNTWMDAKYGDFIATPRYGKVVEINALWYNALMIMSKLTRKIGKIGKIVESKKYEKMAQLCKESFEKEFYNEKSKCLFDYLGNAQIRPNQLFALSLTYPVIDPSTELAENIINTVEKKLLNSYGLKTLAKGEKNYIDIYEGDSFKRDMSYHQGPTWVWLLGLYYNSLMNMRAANKLEKRKNLEEKILKFKEKTYKTFKKEINQRGCIGSISELYDSKTPYNPRGTFAQAWSVAEVFRIIF